MSLLCNIIKAENVKIVGKKLINSSQNDSNSEEIEKVSFELEEKIINIEEEIRLKLEDAEKKYEEIINNARIEGEKLILESQEQVSSIEKKAYEEGHKQGLKNGYEDGYKEVYEEYIEKAKKDANDIICNANAILFDANNMVVNYMKENKSNILNMSVSIAEQVLREKFKDVDSMNSLITSVIEEYELKENFVIKVNPLYKESLDKQILELKENYKLNGDVFVLEDESLNEGNAIIDNTKGSLIIGIDSVVEKVKEELL